jgi:hypothetical protein
LILDEIENQIVAMGALRHTVSHAGLRFVDEVRFLQMAICLPARNHSRTFVLAGPDPHGDASAELPKMPSDFTLRPLKQNGLY